MMKRLLVALLLIVCAAGATFAQKLTYQAIIRDTNQQLVVNTEMQTHIRIHFVEGADYDTTIVASTNIHGLLALEFGNESFSSRNWQNAMMYVSVVNNANHSIIYVHDEVARNVAAVPYALSVNGGSVQSYLDAHNYIAAPQVRNDIHDSIARFDTLINGRVDTLASDSLITLQLNGDTVGQFTLNQKRRSDINFKVQQIQKRFVVANDGQTTFDLGTGVKVDDNFAAQFFINNQMVGTTNGGTASVITISGSTVTYHPDRNGNAPLCEDDLIQVIYFTTHN